MGSPRFLPRAYSKPYKSVADQIALLVSRGMEITDIAAASNCLGRIGYYRLSGYWYPFRKSHLSTNPLTGETLLHPATGKPQVIVEDDFRLGTTFQKVMDLYVFDKRLRLLFLDAIERVEVALRVDIALLIGARDPWAHRDPNQLHGKFSKRVIDRRTGKTEYQKWLERLDATFQRSTEEFVKHFKRKYRGEQPPIWIAIELWDFGMLSVFLSGLKITDQERLASKYGLPRADMLTSWVRNINNVRNICAHHSRLWNRSPADQISPPKVGEIADLDHLAADSAGRSRIYATAAVLQFFLRTLNPTSSWGSRLKSQWPSLPGSPLLNPSQAGFPDGLEALQLWR
jgi:abortive infection bacteriophage resistance protein